LRANDQKDEVPVIYFTVIARVDSVCSDYLVYQNVKTARDSCNLKPGSSSLRHESSIRTGGVFLTCRI